jgi:uncharacterized membrane protein YfcA
MIALAIPLGIAIGLVVGAVGGGGAILALPVLVYLLDQPVGPASTASLVVVAVAAGVGAGALARHGHVCWGLALAFSAPAAIGSILGAMANDAVSPRVLILSFVPVMAVAAGATWQRAAGTRAEEDAGCPSIPVARVALAGAGVGVLTGFFGVGGGFMIVPVLTLWLGVGFRRAVATSLVIITITGVAALTSHLVVGARMDHGITVALALATAAGAVLGTTIGTRVPQAVLGRAFAIVVAGIGVFLLVDVVVLGGPPGA